MEDSVTPEFLDRFAEAWNRHDADAIVACMTPDCVMYLSAGDDPKGLRAAGREAVRAAALDIFETLPDAHWVGAQHFITGDRGVSQWTFTATRPDGTKIRVAGCDVFTFRDQLIAVKDSYRKQVNS
jgi:ketosteroid isomerase-like protein